MANSRDFTGKNRKFTGTKGIITPKGTTGERVGAESGELRFNTTIELMEYYDGNVWITVDAPPTISGISTSDATGSNTVLNADGSTLYTITITGSNFNIGCTVKFIGNTGTEYNAGNVTRVSGTSITCTTLSNMGTADDPYDVRVANTSGLSALFEDAFSYNAAPVFVNASGQLASAFSDGSQTFSGSTINAGATDAEGNTITHTIISGSLPSGLTIASSTGYITGAVTGPPSLGNYPFVVRAATAEGVAERQFSIQIVANPFMAATGGTVTTVGDYKTHIFTGPGSFVVTSAGSPAGSNSVEYAVVAGGGSGGNRFGGGGGAGGYRTNFPSPSTAGLPVSSTTYPISVAGGGGSSSFSSISTNAGGPGGNGDSGPGNPGGSGGGGAGRFATGGGGGNAGGFSPPEGNPGPGIGGGQPFRGAGGGGASASGGGQGDSSGGTGAYLPDGFFGPTAPSYGTSGPVGSTRYFAGGGGGGGSGDGGPGDGAPGGAGGGGQGGPVGGNGTSGQTNTGGGGGGGPYPPTSAGGGGSGIVIIRYKYQ